MRGKKLFAVLAGIIITLSSAVSAYAGEVSVGSLKYSDTNVYINNYPIPSYEFEGETYICLEHLEGYGFNLIWDEDNNSKCIVRGNGNYITSVPTFKSREDQVGQEYKKLYKCSVKAYLGNYEKEIQCYKIIEGYLFIKASELAYFGKVEEATQDGTYKIWIDGLETRDSLYPLRPDPYPVEYRKNIIPSDIASWNISNGNSYITTVISFNEGQNKITVVPSGSIEISVIDINGNVIGGKTEHFSIDDYSIYPYFYNYVDNARAISFGIEHSSLKPAPYGKAVVKCKVNAGDNVYEFERNIEGLPSA
ncbi:hypothetical protein NE664_09125 [Anaerotignum faecicola]|nr:hypothetical protein [Anaerotignum faecicola]